MGYETWLNGNMSIDGKHLVAFEVSPTYLSQYQFGFDASGTSVNCHLLQTALGGPGQLFWLNLTIHSRNMKLQGILLRTARTVFSVQSLLFYH